MRVPYEYAAIQAVPRVDRGELINVGVVLYCQRRDFLAARTHLAPERLRALDPATSTELEPVLSLRRATAAPLERGRFTKLTIPLYYQGHAYRKGSRIRVTITAPNGTQPIWSTTQPRPAKGTARVWVSSSPKHASRLLLPVVPGLGIPTGYPACPSLRNEPCRSLVPFANLAG